MSVTSSLRGKVLAIIRSYLLGDATLVTALEHTAQVNKIVVDKMFYATPYPYILLTTVGGGRYNADPRKDFGLYVLVRAEDTDIARAYTVYGQAENRLTDAMLPDTYGIRFYAPVRATDASYFDEFKLSQTDYFRVGGQFYVRGVFIQG